MLINFVRSDRHYDFYWEVKVGSKEKLEELLKKFREKKVDNNNIYDSPEYFKAYLKEQGIECQSLSSTEVAQIFYGE